MTNLFKHSQIMTTLREIISIKLQPQIELLHKKMILLKSKPISYFQIAPEFRPIKCSLNNSDGLMGDSEDQLKIISSPVFYKNSTKRLLDISKANTPIGKVKTILLASKEIVSDLNTFYQR
jgi:hypothetical protein